MTIKITSHNKGYAKLRKGFFGTIYLTEETLLRVIFDICNSIYKKADNIFITSFHHNDKVIQKFINEKSDFFQPTKIVYLEMYAEEDEKQIEKMIGGHWMIMREI